MGPRSAASTPASAGRAERVGGTLAADDSVIPSGVDVGNNATPAQGISNQDLARFRELLVLLLLWRAGALATPALTAWIFLAGDPTDESNRKQTTRLLARMAEKELIIGTPAPELESMPTAQQIFLWRLAAKGARFLIKNGPASGADFFGNLPVGKRATDFDLPRHWLHHCVLAQYLAQRFREGYRIIFDAEIRRCQGAQINRKMPDGLCAHHAGDPAWEALELENARKSGASFRSQIQFAAATINHGETDVCGLRVTRISVLRINNKFAPTAARFAREIGRQIVREAQLNFVDLDLNMGARVIRADARTLPIYPAMDRLRLIQLDHPDRYREVRETLLASSKQCGLEAPEEFIRIGTYKKGPLSGEIRAAFDSSGRAYFEMSLLIHAAPFFANERVGPLFGLKELEPYLETAMAWGTVYGKAHARVAYERALRTGGSERFLPKLRKWRLNSGLV